MSQLSADDIYRYARAAGFTQQQATVMTAIALRESSGNTTARLLNAPIEDSQGLWQINTLAHPQFRGQDLYNPMVNAQAAYQVAGGQSFNLQPWKSPKGYLPWLGQAQSAAARAEGHLSLPSASSQKSSSAGGPTAQKLIAEAMRHVGAKYSAAPGQRTWAPSVDLPPSFDCSGFVQYLVKKIIDPNMSYDVSWNQYNISKSKGLAISVDQARKTAGAILVKPGMGPQGHVAISLGNGDTIESHTGGVSVVKGGASQSYFTEAALIPGLNYGATSDTTTPDTPPPANPQLGVNLTPAVSLLSRIA